MNKHTAHLSWCFLFFLINVILCENIHVFFFSIPKQLMILLMSLLHSFTMPIVFTLLTPNDKFVMNWHRTKKESTPNKPVGIVFQTQITYMQTHNSSNCFPAMHLLIWSPGAGGRGGGCRPVIPMASRTCTGTRTATTTSHIWWHSIVASGPCTNMLTDQCAYGMSNYHFNHAIEIAWSNKWL